MPHALLPDRAFLTVEGDEAASFLQALITTDIEDIGDGEMWPGALLTPQGKIFFEFLIGRSENGFLLETAQDFADALLKRLTLYKLRAKVVLAKKDASAVAVAWGDDASAADGYRDMRFARADCALYRKESAETAGENREDYHTLRITHTVSGGAEDGGLTDYFPHDLLMDRNGGLDFRKGCYVGQEVVSRMQHRSTARRRLVRLVAEDTIDGTADTLSAGGKEIGTVISRAAHQALAVVRIDKAGDALRTATPFALNDQIVTVELAPWSGLDWPAEAGADEA